MPSPSSLTRMTRRPPPSVNTSMRWAPASSAFSISSFTTLAGRSTTSPAAMRLTTDSVSWRTGMALSIRRRDSTGATARRRGARCVGRPNNMRRRYSIEGFACRRPLMPERRFLASKRRAREALVGLVGRRGVGGTAARRISSTRRASASSRLRSWVRWRCAVITRTPSLVRRLPARRSSRVRTASSSDGEPRTSKRSCTAVDSLLTFCPPGPEARMNRSSSSFSSMAMRSVTWIIGLSLRAPCRASPESITTVWAVMASAAERSEAGWGIPVKARTPPVSALRAETPSPEGEGFRQSAAVLHALRAPDHGDQEAIEQALGDATRVGDADRIDHAAAAIDIVDAEVVELDLHQLAGDLRRGVEAKRIGSLEERFRPVELFLGRSGLGQPLDLLLDDVDRLAGAFGARAGAAQEQRRMIEPDQRAVDRIGKSALLAHLAIEARGERAAAEDVVDDIGGHEVRVLARDAVAAEGHHRLWHVHLDDDALSEPLQMGGVDGRQVGLGRQPAEHLVEHCRGGGRIDVADHADLQLVAGKHAAGVILEIADA